MAFGIVFWAEFTFWKSERKNQSTFLDWMLVQGLLTTLICLIFIFALLKSAIVAFVLGCKNPLNHLFLLLGFATNNLGLWCYLKADFPN